MIASVIESIEPIADHTNFQSTKIADTATYVMRRVHNCRGIEIPIFFTKIGYKLSNDSDASFDKIGIIIWRLYIIVQQYIQVPILCDHLFVSRYMNILI
jgi:hypothetical protein